MRGKVNRSEFSDATSRITPAYAGKSFCVVGAVMWVQDHPRLCGEKTHPLEPQVLRQGSPPPMRGKAGFAYNIDAINRITPAYAGKSPRGAWYTVYRGDHPRLCGEKQSTSDDAAKLLRITPAYAGKSCTLYRRINRM